MEKQQLLKKIQNVIDFDGNNLSPESVYNLSEVMIEIGKPEEVHVPGSRVLTCVYCGHRYPQNTPPHSDDILTEHIKICPKHPLRAAEDVIAKLRFALSALVGSDDEEVLKSILRETTFLEPAGLASSRDVAVMANAVKTLLETSEYKGGDSAEQRNNES